MKISSVRLSPGIWSSLAAHGVLVLLLVFGLRLQVEPVTHLRLPGTKYGDRMLLSYSAGGHPQPGEPTPAPPVPPHRIARRHVNALTAPTQLASAPQAVVPGPGSAASSGQGDGDIKIALPQFNPRPQPDLSSLPHGTSGNVVVDVVIDTGGKVTQLTLVKGLGAPIDDAVLRTVHTWLFTPATRDGAVVSSEQEILVHYERG